ncbi:MAG: hypothetical protein IJX08_09485 [Clostridia bacterium]|nr:hypothetical protein [Clostridia bacterium]
MDIKKLGKALLFPHFAIMIVLLPVSIVLLVYSMVFMGTESVIAIISYVLSAYTLTIWCFKIPYLVRFFKAFKEENKYARIWQDDTRLRVNISLYGTLILNTAYAVLQLGLGFWHHTFWFYSLAAYYITLAVMRFFLVRHTSKHRAGEKMGEELVKYRACGMVFLVMNLALSVIIFFMVYWNRTFHHHEITTIAMAAYTFTALTIAIINVIKYRKYNSPVYSASKIISLASACVSMLTLESTMLTTFGAETMDLTERRIMLAASGGVISVFIITMAVYMIVQATKKINLLNMAKEHLND